MTKKQFCNNKFIRVFVNTTGSTADRDTECDDIQYNDYAFKLSNGVCASRYRKMRSDIVG